MCSDEACLARNGLDHRDPMPLGECEERCFGKGVVDTTASEDQRLLGAAQRIDRCCELAPIGSGPNNPMMLCRNKLVRDTKCHGLHILRQAEECRATVCGIEHGVDRLRQ